MLSHNNQKFRLLIRQLSLLILSISFFCIAAQAITSPSTQAVIRFDSAAVQLITAGSVGDFNGDGNVDLAITVIAAPDKFPQLAVLYGDTLGGFTRQQFIPFRFHETGGLIAAITTANLNKDQFDDLVIAFNGGRVMVLSGSGGNIGTSNPFNTDQVGFISTLRVADFNSDGHQDIFVSSQGLGSVSIYSDVGSGVYTKISGAVIPETHFPGEIGDINRDGKTDIIFPISTNGSIESFINKGDGTFIPNGEVSDGGLSPVIKATDLNRDGKIEMLSLDPEGGLINVRTSNSTGAFDQSSKSLSTSKNPVALGTGDINGDGVIDIATASFAEGKVTVFWGKNNSDGTVGFSETTDIKVGEVPISMLLADVNKDGKLDIITLERGSNTITISSFTARQPIPTNLLKNSSFDDGQPGLGLTELPAWSVWQGNVDVIPGTESNPLGVWHQAADGANSLELMGTPGVGGIAQAVPTITGKKYKLSGSIAHHHGVSQAGVWVWIGDQWVPTPLHHSGTASQANMNWQRFDIEFVAKSESTVIGFIDRNLDYYDYGGAMLDGLSVTLVETAGNISKAAPRSTSSSESVARAVTSEEMLKMMLAHPSVKGDLQKQAAIRKQFQERRPKNALAQPIAMRLTPTPPPNGKGQPTRK